MMTIVDLVPVRVGSPIYRGAEDPTHGVRESHREGAPEPDTERAGASLGSTGAGRYPPSTTSNRSEAKVTDQGSTGPGESHATASGSAAPTAKVPTDAIAACSGRAR